MMNGNSATNPASNMHLRRGRVWLAVAVCLFGQAVACADDAALPVAGSSTTAGAGQPVLEDQVLREQRAPVAGAGQVGAAVQPFPPAQIDDLGTTNNSNTGADTTTSDGLARLLGPATTAPGAPTFDYSALARDVGDQTRYGDPLDDAEPDARASEHHNADSGTGVHGTISVSVGTGGMRSTRASLTVPVIDDELTVRITGEQGRNTLNRYDSSSIFDDAWLSDRRHGGRGRNDDWYRNEDSSSLGLDVRWTPDGATREVRRRASESGGR